MGMLFQRLLCRDIYGLRFRGRQQGDNAGRCSFGSVDPCLGLFYDFDFVLGVLETGYFTTKSTKGTKDGI